MSGFNYCEERFLNKAKKSFQSADAELVRFYRALGQWGYYVLIASTLLVSCIQEAKEHLKPARPIPATAEMQASKLCELESKALGPNQKTSCGPQLASGGFVDWHRIFNTTNSEKPFNPLKQTPPYWEQKKGEPY